MPYISRPKKIASAVALAGAALMAAAAPALAAGGSCETPLFTQPFASAGDTHNYVLAPGQTADNFEAEGWTLSGGAKTEKVKLADGKRGLALVLPSGSSAVSPVFCVTDEYPTARMLVDDVTGAEGVFFNVAYEGTNTWTNPKNSGQVHGKGTQWTLSGSVNMQPENILGWQKVRLTLTPGGNSSLFEVYDLYIDPYSR